MAVETPGEGTEATRVDVARLTALTHDLFAAHGLADDDATTCAEALVEADLRGVWSHGVARVPMYCRRLDLGAAKANPDIVVTAVAPACRLVDGDDGLGLVVARRAMQEAIAAGKECGIGLAGVRRSGHFGMAALYIKQAIDAGCLGWAFTNASPALPPWGAAKAHFGTSPFAFGAPTAENDAPFLVDMAMSTVARGKLRFAAARGEPIPPGLALDKDGRPTTDGMAAFHGTMLPFGGVKGAAMSWMMDVLGGVFTGAGFGGAVANPFDGLDRKQNVGHVFIAARADLFMTLDAFTGRMREGTAKAKALPKADGVAKIYAPGEPEAERRARNLKEGVPLTRDVIRSLADLAAAKGVDPRGIG